MEKIRTPCEIGTHVLVIRIAFVSIGSEQVAILAVSMFAIFVIGTVLIIAMLIVSIQPYW